MALGERLYRRIQSYIQSWNRLSSLAEWSGKAADRLAVMTAYSVGSQPAKKKYDSSCNVFSYSWFCDCGVIGSRSRLKICRDIPVPVRFRPVAPSFVSTPTNRFKGSPRQRKLCIALLVCLQSFYGAIVYRLGHKVFILGSGVRFPVALPVLQVL